MKKRYALLSGVIGLAIGAAGTSLGKNNEMLKMTEKKDRFKAYYNLVNQWLILKNEGKRLEDYFLCNGYNKIAIYGMGELGNRLYEELKDSKVQIKYGIDQKAKESCGDLKVYEIEDMMSEEIEEVDAIVITPVYDIDEIEEELSQAVSCELLSLNNVVFSN